MASQYSDPHDQLRDRYQRIERTILSRQNPITGLLPASTAVNSHGDYTDAWVRDNVYSILAVWGLWLAYRKLGVQDHRTYELQQSTIRLMRGLLAAMMRQSPKVERFKVTQSPMDALHAKYDTHTGSTVVGDGEWGHLQIDATSIYLLMLAQMTASGLQIVASLDEVNFIQNLVYYIGRAYRTADYGIWERGNKINHGNPELNASSIGMAKAALEALNGLNLYGQYGSQASVIHVLDDEAARARITLESLLPRESASKEVDAALLSVIGFPAFAIEDLALVERTRQNILDKLAGRYGCKRFLRDGHQTVLEDTSRLHYEPYELKAFEHIECEWPLFFAYLLLDAVCRGDRATADHYNQRLHELAVERDGVKLLPEVYYVPAEAVDAERETPQSQPRRPNDNVPLVWAQSLWEVGMLLLDGFLDLEDIDPLNRRSCPGGREQNVVQIALLAEDGDLQRRLAEAGIATQTPEQIAPVRVRHARDLAIAYAQVGRNDKLGLSGRPLRRLRSLATSYIFNLRGETVVFLPAFLDPEQFYLSLDVDFALAQVRSELAYTYRHWNAPGRPTLTLLLTHAILGNNHSDEGVHPSLLTLLAEFQAGTCEGVPVRLGSLAELLPESGIGRIDFLHGLEFSAPAMGDRQQPTSGYLPFDPAATAPLNHIQEFEIECETDPDRLLDRLRHTGNLYEQIEILQELWRLEGPDYETGLGGDDRAVLLSDLLDELYVKASGTDATDATGVPLHRNPYWSIVRRIAGLENKADISLSDAVTDLLVRQKLIAVGRAYSPDATIDRPMSHEEIIAKIDRFCGEDIRDRVLSQEILIALGVMIKTTPHRFKGFLTLRVNYFILLLTSQLAREQILTQDEAYEALMELSPFEIKTRLRQVIDGYQGATQALQRQESLHLQQPQQAIQWVLDAQQEDAKPPAGSWMRQRELDGTLNRVPKNFYQNVWTVLGHCRGLVIGDKLERRNRLDSGWLLAEMTPGEKNFALQVEHLLNKIEAPTYRQVCIETLIELAALIERNPELHVADYLVLDVLIGHAVRLAWVDRNADQEQAYAERKAQAWQQFYEMSPYACAGYIVRAFQFLLEMGAAAEEGDDAEVPETAEIEAAR